SASPLFVTVIVQVTTSPGFAVSLSTVLTAWMLGWASTVVSVEQSGSSDCAGQLLPGPTTTTVLGRCVVPSGNEVSSVAEKWRTLVPPLAARSNAGQVMTLPF